MGTTDTPALPPSRSPLSARSFGTHLLLGELIGRGGMSRVYRGWVRGNGLEVAVKVLRDDLAARPDAVQRFVRERDLLQAVASPHVVRVHDLVVHGDELGIVMDLVPGGHLRKAVSFPCTLGVAAELAAQVAEGLAAVHAAGVVHRDLKPENVLVETGPDGIHRLRLTDFGISRLVDSAALTQTSVTGTPGYLAPEVATGARVTAAADVYALGILLYELCTGRQPFHADNPLLLVLAHTRQEPPRPLGMPDPLWALIASMLAKQPAARPDAVTSARALRALVPQLEGLPPCVVPTPDPVVAAVPAAPATPMTPPPPSAPATSATEHATPSARRSEAYLLLEPGGTPTTGPTISGAPGGPGRRADERRTPEAPRPWSSRPVRIAGALGLALAVIAGGVGAFQLTRSGSTAITTSVRPGPTSAPKGPAPATRSSSSGTPSSTTHAGASSHHLQGGVAPVAVTSSHPASPKTTASASSASGKPSITTTSTSTTPSLPPPAMPTLAHAVLPEEAHSSDAHATLAIGNVAAGTGGTLASVTVRYVATGHPMASQAVALMQGAATYQITVGGLVNGTAYTFAVDVCDAAKQCTTSALVAFTPYGAPQVPTPRLSVAGLVVKVTADPVVRNANPNPTVCTVKLTGTPADAGAISQTVSADGGTVTYTGKATTAYTAVETCTTAAVQDTSAASVPVTTGAA